MDALSRLDSFVERLTARWPFSEWVRLSLTIKMSALVAFGLVALVSIFGFLMLAASRETTDRALHERVIMAQLAASHLDYIIGDMERDLRFTADDLASGGTAPEKALTEFMFRSGPAFRRAFLADAAGAILASYPAQPSPTRIGPEAIQAMQVGGFALLHTELPGVGPAVVASSPVPAPEGSPSRVVFASLDLAWPEMTEFIGMVALGDTGYLEVVDQRGVILLSTRAEHVLTAADHGNSLVGLIDAGRSAVSTCHNCHEAASGGEITREVMAFAPLQRKSWGVVIRQSEEEAFAASRELQRRIVLVGALAVAGAMALVWLTTGIVISPARRLTQVAGRIAGGDLATPVTVRGSDEFARLGLSLDDMRDRLQTNMAEIKALNRDLDRRVQERTKQCVLAQETLIVRNRELSVINAVATAVTQPLLLDDLLGKVLGEVLRVTGISVGAVFLVEDETKDLELKVYRGTSEEAAQAMIRLHMGDGDCGGVLNKTEPVVVPDLRHYRAGAGGLLRQAGLCSLVHVPLITRGMTLGTLCVASLSLRDFDEEEVSLLMAVGNQIALGVENARLYGEIARREQLRGELLQKLISAQEDERKRIARDLHDDTSQSITALIYSLEAAEGKCASPETRTGLTSMRQLATQTLEGIHKLIFDLRPSLLDHLGFFVALRWYAESRLQPAGIRAHFHEQGTDRRLPPHLETSLFRVTQEAINNIARHAGARNVSFRVVRDDQTVTIDILDDGIGFDPAEVSRSVDQTRGLGLVGMEERVELLAGSITFDSEPGRGTRVTISVPIVAEQPAQRAFQGVR